MCITGGYRIDFDCTAREAPSTGWRQTVRRAPGDHLFYEGDDRTHIFVIETGWVKLYRTLIDGQRQVVGFSNGGTVLGLESERTHANGCEAITQVTVRAIPANRLSEICDSDPHLARQLLWQVGRQLGAAQAQLTAVGSQSADQRLATFLLAVADHGGASAADEFDLPMRRGDMADFLGLRLETVSRKMSDFQRRGWIRMTSLYRCRILRRSVLRELAEGAVVEATAAEAA
jgi:CRP/FNR family transcriptional regulator